MAALLGPEIFSRGFRFDPSPLEAATYYLPRLIAGAALHEAVRPVVHHADVYALEPAELARRFFPLPRTGHRFFFTSCKKGVRVAGPGSWNLQSTTDIKDGAEAKVGEVKKFRYKKRGVFTDWLMDEFSTCSLEDAVAGDRQYVFCNIYVSPRATPDSPAHQESAAIFAPPVAAPMVENKQAAPKIPAPVVIAPAVAPKRPAPPQSSELPCPKRMRSSVPMTPPVVQPVGCTTRFVPRCPCVPNHGVPPSWTPAPAQPPANQESAAFFVGDIQYHQYVQPAGCTMSFAPPWPCFPNHGVDPSVIWSPVPASALPPAPAPIYLAAPPRSLVQPEYQMPLPTPAVAPSSTNLVTRPPPPPPAPRRVEVQPDHSPAATPLQPRSPPKQQMPPPTPPETRASDMPVPVVQAPARHCRPQQSMQTKQRIRDPFEAAELREREAEEERIAAAAAAAAAAHDLASMESPAAALEDVDLDELAKMLEDDIPACDGSGMTDEEAYELACLLENEIVIVPKEEIA